ncbi:class I SAM-dependent methyltransferase [Paenibacillus aestuarii]|uniref:Class I SAM-dependent methyltransferase n=1 Tax=Paenibacillus aestuarii TaxID=516965 RepID=A0ABW0K8B0_9BACL|nr:class I SAM-dependent methyltransferase [Paenibacillus aestuarii]
MNTCNICGNYIDDPVYTSSNSISITSLCEVVKIDTKVYFCNVCGHLGNEAISNLDDYYDHNYKLLVNSEEEDQLYDVVNNQKVYRTEHQVMTLLRKLNISEGAKVLDYGCAKGATLRELVKIRPDITPYLFDVSKDYIPYWSKFVNSNNWAVYQLKTSWWGNFELITSFFSLEHVAKPREFIENIAELLMEDGTFYCIIPNVYANIADFIVVDHVNHFSSESIRFLFETCGLKVIEIDEFSHNGAFVIVAKKQANKAEYIPIDRNIEVLLQNKVHDIAEYWKQTSIRIQEFESMQSDNQTAAIYGSGFYGTFIFTCLKNTSKIKYFIDQNSFVQGKQIFGKKIIPPNELEDQCKVIYVGLNPLRAASIINSISSWKDKKYTIFYPMAKCP